MADQPAFAATPRMDARNHLVTDGTANVNIAVGGDNGSRITSLVLHNKAATAREVYVSLTDGTNTVRLCQVSVNATGGTVDDLLSTVNLPEDAHNNSFVVLPGNGWAVAVGLNAAVGTDNDVSIVAMGGDF